MQILALLLATCLLGLATAQQFNWYTDTKCKSYMTSTGGPGAGCDGTPYGANSVLMANCGDAECIGWTWYTSNQHCDGDHSVYGLDAACTNCVSGCQSGICLDIGDRNAFNWAEADANCDPSK